MDATLPLQGKRILVPRGKKEAKSFSALIEKNGGIPIEIPLLAFRPISPSDEIQEIIKNINTYDWIIFTSNVTVETFLSFLKNNALTLPKIAVIGKRTASVLRERGFEVHFTPEVYVAEAFVREFTPHIVQGMKVFIPKGNLARDVIGEALKRENVIVDELIVYETFLPEDSKMKLTEAISERKIDILTFTSPSTVDHFMEVITEHQLQRNVDECLISCIGPITKEKIESVGLRVDVIPESYTVDDMLRDIVLYLQG